jgi:site-specific DNA-methyltransferase (adenine-specific)
MTDNQYKRPNQPDVLEVIANLSNNEVFTPPRVVNSVLDLLPESVWSDPTLRWLDPGSKTGVFPREITKRLMVGLSQAIPDDVARLQHILGEMVFAFAITDMTAMMTRRSLYCSKSANSELAATRFPTPEGNVWHERIEHNFDNKGRCVECGGTRVQLEQQGRDNYAYGFIHDEGRKQITKETNMKFDVIVGNPPYQMDADAEGQNIVPIYDRFVREAIKLAPRYIAMIIPSRWLAGGKWLDEFRDQMLKDARLRKIVDYANAKDLFPGIEIKGGVLYFLWDRDNPGLCSSIARRGDDIVGPVERVLSEYDVFVRDARSLPILEKVLKKKEMSFADLVSTRDPFGPALSSNFTGYRKGERKSEGDIRLYMNVGSERVVKWVAPEYVTKNESLVRRWKIFVPKAYGAGESIPHQILGQTIVAGPPSASTLTYLCVGPFKSRTESESADSYLHTRFVRFLVSLRKISQDTTQKVFTWVPQQTWDRTWTDAELYKKYGITKSEQEYIASLVKEMPA